MTDEEIVKALENCINGFDVLKRHSCDVCPYKEVEACGKAQMIDLLDLIKRQKAEIERLTKEHERIAWSKQEYIEWVHGFLSTHTDMKDRGEKYEMFDRDWMCNVFWEKIKGSIDYIIDLENQRNELQKQVDELKTVKASYVNEIIEKAVKDTAKEICEMIDGSCIPSKGYLCSKILKRYVVEVE